MLTPSCLREELFGSGNGAAADGVRAYVGAFNYHAAIIVAIWLALAAVLIVAVVKWLT